MTGLHCRALVMVSSSIRLTAWLQKFKEAGGTVREIDVWAESPRLSPLWVICIIVCLAAAVNHYRDNAITYKAQRDKNARELKLANAAITDMQMRQRDVAALDAKYTKEWLTLKLKWCSAWWCCRSLVIAHQSSLSVSVKLPTPPAWIMQPPRLADTAESDYFTLRERSITMQKQLEGTQKYINEQCR